MPQDFRETAPMHTRSEDNAPMLKVTREISVQWLATIAVTIVFSVLGNWGALFLSVREGEIRQQNSAERQKDNNEQTNANIKALTEKVEKLVSDGLTRKDSDKDQDYSIKSLESRVLRLEGMKK